MLLTSAYLAPVHYYTKLYSSALAQLCSDAKPLASAPDSLPSDATPLPSDVTPLPSEQPLLPSDASQLGAALSQSAAISGGHIIIEEQADHYVKQTYRNRCIIAGDDGPIALTIPVSAPAPSAVAGQPQTDGVRPLSISKTPMHAVLISEHGNWRHQHWQAIVSAYKSSPYFEYYADDFSAVFHRPLTPEEQSRGGQRLVDFNAALRNFVLDALDLYPIIVPNREHYIMPGPQQEGRGEALGRFGADYRETIRPKVPFTTDPTFRPAPYYQVFALRHGFLPNMSIIDLLFNMGPESRIVLRDSIV